MTLLKISPDFVKFMFSFFARFIFSLIFIAAASFGVNAQIDAGTSNGKPKDEDYPKNIKETLAKSRIEREKKDYEELLQYGEEALQLSKDLEQSFADNNQLSAADRKKLDRLEKVFKKIRKELGGDGDEDSDAAEKSPNTFQTAFEVLQENTVKLVDELKKSTRFTISAVAIQSSNLLLKAVRFLRFDN